MHAGWQADREHRAAFGALLAVIWPPCDWTIRRQIASPRPMPVSFVLT